MESDFKKEIQLKDEDKLRLVKLIEKPSEDVKDNDVFDNSFSDDNSEDS